MAATTLYQTLSLDKPQIRLLKLDASSSDDSAVIPTITLQTFDFTNAPEYKALSYMWGPKDNPQVIKVNGFDFIVRQNLNSFLEAFRTHEDRLWIWIDQICINQDDLVEKGKQVQMMGEIYSKAAETFIWLGPDPYDGILSPLVESVLSKYDEESKSFSETDDYDRSDPRFSFGDQVWKDMLDAEREAYFAALNHAYWTRHWVAQEIVSSELVSLLQRASRIDLREIRRFVELLGPSYQRIVECRYIFWLLRITAEHPKGAWSHLAFMSQFMLQSHCDDLRDKIYGIQSLLPPDFQVSVNYQLSIEELYMTSAQRWYAAMLRWQAERNSSRITSDIALDTYLDCAVGMGLIVERDSDGFIMKLFAQYLIRGYALEIAAAQGEIYALNDESEWRAIECTLRELLKVAGADGNGRTLSIRQEYPAAVTGSTKRLI